MSFFGLILSDDTAAYFQSRLFDEVSFVGNLWCHESADRCPASLLQEKTRDALFCSFCHGQINNLRRLTYYIAFGHMRGSECRDDKSPCGCSKGDSSFFREDPGFSEAGRGLLQLDFPWLFCNVGVVFPFQAPSLPITETCTRPCVVGRMRGCTLRFSSGCCRRLISPGWL